MCTDGRPHRSARAVVALALAVLAGACSSGKPAAAPEVTSAVTAPEATSTTATSSTTSTTVRSSTSTTRTTVATAVSIGPGEAFIGGTVLGPAGPIDGATVRIERLVGSATASADVITSGGGAWRMDSVLGGAYRIRAFKPPDLGQSNVEVFFLAATDRKTVDLRLTGSGAGGQQITAVLNPTPPRVNQPSILTVQVGSPRVDEQGRPVIIPAVGAVLQLSVGAGQALESTPQVTTDAAGSASWRLRCLVEGPNPVTLTIGTGVTQVGVPPCVAGSTAPAATTTTQPR